MRVRRSWHAAAWIGLPVMLLVTACLTAYQEGVDDPKYGTGKLDRPDLNVPDAASSGSGDCTTPATPEGGTCGVSFKQILESFRAVGCASSSCHGGSSQTPPHIDPDNAAATYDVFSKFVIPATGQKYIDPCSTDPSKSAMACNLSSSDCGNRMPQNATYDSAKLNEVMTWLACGSPNN